MKGDAAAPTRAILGDAFPAQRINVKAVGGGLQGVLEAFIVSALGTVSCQKFTMWWLLWQAFLKHVDHMTRSTHLSLLMDCVDAGHACPGKDLGVRNVVLPLYFRKFSEVDHEKMAELLDMADVDSSRLKCIE